MVVIGIVGGIASGKTEIAEQFRRLGAELLSADRLGHEVLREEEVQQAIRQRWGASVLDERGNVDRTALARIVFAPPPAGPPQLAYLEQITHPRIGRRVQQRIAELARRSELKAVVLDAPLLLEAGWDAFCDTIVFVEAAHQLRFQRAVRRGWTAADFAAREAAQKSLNEKRRRADWVIDNSHSPEAAFAQVQQVWRSLD